MLNDFFKLNQPYVELDTPEKLLELPVHVERADTAEFRWKVSGSAFEDLYSSVPFDLLYDLVNSDGTYIDVHTVAHPTGARGRVVVTSSTVFLDICD